MDQPSTTHAISLAVAKAMCRAIYTSRTQAHSQALELQDAGYLVMLHDPPARTLTPHVENVAWVRDASGRTVGDIRYRIGS